LILEKRSPFLIGIFMAFTYQIRSAGAIFLPVYFLHLLLSREKKLKLYILPAIAFITLNLIFLKIFGKDTTYFNIFDFSSIKNLLSIFLSNSKAYILSFSDFFTTPILKKLFFYLSLVVFVFASFGFSLIIFKNKISFLDLYFVAHIVLILILPAFQGARFLMPVFPIYFYYFFVGLKHFEDKIKFDLLKKVSITFFIFSLLMIGGALVYKIQGKYKPSNHIDSFEAKDLFSWVKTNVKENEIVIFGKPRVLGFFTKHFSAVYPPTKDPNIHKQFYEKIKPTYLVISKNGIFGFNEKDLLSEYMKINQENMKFVYENNEFLIYKFNWLNK
jgi:hypothetical protein